jgi:ProP effector
MAAILPREAHYSRGLAISRLPMNDTSSESLPAVAGAEPPAPQEEPAIAAAAQPQQEQKQKQKQKPKAPAGRPVHQVLERLFQLYPKLFGARFLPLKLGVFQELMALHPNDFTKDELKAALGVHARSTRYLESVASGEKRHDLNGLPVEHVAPEHVHHAIMEVFRRRQARSKEDLRPWLRSRLVKVIEASGLTREQYNERVPTQDAIAAAALDEAFAELTQQAAKREALRRAFEASGKSMEAFAEMYGMDPQMVRRTLAASARRD